MTSNYTRSSYVGCNIY